jgi:AraC-like DNA-binding protein
MTARISKGFSTKAVASDLNFANSTHFCREFKKVFGATPQNFGPMWQSPSEMSGIEHNVAVGLSTEIERT